MNRFTRIAFERLVAPTRKALATFKRLETAIVAELNRGNYRVTEAGVVIANDLVFAGKYFGSIVGVDGRVRDEFAFNNALLDQGANKMLEVMFGDEAKLSAWYLGIGLNDVSINAATLNAANIASTLGEITSTSEGYTGNRKAFTPGNAVARSIDNNASQAVFPIVCATSINIQNSFLISDLNRGGTAGVAASAATYADARQVFNGENFRLGYVSTLNN